MKTDYPRGLLQQLEKLSRFSISAKYIATIQACNSK